jgi:hypothetical protein
MATAFGARLLGAALVVILDSTYFREHFSAIIAAESKWTTKAVPNACAPKRSAD